MFFFNLNRHFVNVPAVSGRTIRCDVAACKTMNSQIQVWVVSRVNNSGGLLTLHSIHSVVPSDGHC